MKQLLASLIVLCGIFSASAAFSVQPHISPMDIRGAQGSKVLCEGVLYLAQDAPSCVGSKGACTAILVDGCSASLNYAQAAQCNTSLPDKGFMDAFRAANLPDLNQVENDSIQAAKTQYPKLSRYTPQDISKTPEFQHIFLTKWNSRPHVRISGTLESCSTCPECFPTSQCTISHCKAVLVKPPEPK